MCLEMCFDFYKIQDPQNNTILNLVKINISVGEKILMCSSLVNFQCLLLVVTYFEGSLLLLFKTACT